MRIANNNIFHTVTSNLARNQERFFRTEQVAASGKRLQRLSTDPPALGRMLRLRTTIASQDQYQRHIDQATSWLNVTDASLTQVADMLMRAKELTLSQASSTANAETRAGTAKEVDMLLQQAIQAGNAKLGNQFLFAGRKTNVVPFSSSGSYQGDSGTIDVEIGQGTVVTVNTPGDVAFKGAGGGVDLLSVLQTLKTALEGNDRAGVEAQLTPLDNSLNQVVKARAEVGAKVARLSREKERLLEANEHVMRVLEETEGADLAKTLSDLAQQEFVYQASLAASARAIQPTLLDFLR